MFAALLRSQCDSFAAFSAFISLETLGFFLFLGLGQSGIHPGRLGFGELADERIKPDFARAC